MYVRYVISRDDSAWKGFNGRQQHLGMFHGIGRLPTKVLNKREMGHWHRLRGVLAVPPIYVCHDFSRCAFTKAGEKKFKTLIKLFQKCYNGKMKRVILKSPNIIWEDEHQIVFATKPHA